MLKLFCKSISLSLLTVGLIASQSYGQAPISYQGKPAKYVFLFIGDGMSFPQVASLGVYKGTMDNHFIGTNKNPTIENQPKAYLSTFEQFPILGAARTYDASKFITDSAAAATAIATGHKTLDGRLGIDALGNPVPSIATLMKQSNYKIGIITTVSLNHATPAGFYAHQNSRSQYYEIGLDLINSNFDYFGGGSFYRATGQNKDQTNLLELAKQKYKIVNQKEAILNLKPSNQKVIAINPVLDNSMSFPFSLVAGEDSLTLADFTRKGIELLQHDNKQGFFMMIEGGKIDWAAHGNDALTAIKDVEALEKAVDEAVKFYHQYPEETLIVVTGDHETGGMTIGFAGAMYDTFFSLLNKQIISYEEYEKIIAQYRDQKTPFNNVLKDIEKYYGLISPENVSIETTPALILNAREMAMLEKAYTESMIPFEERNRDLAYTIHYNMYGYEPLQVTVTHILNNKAGIGWTTSAHSGLPAAVYAIGAGQELFTGFYENTGIFDRIKAITKVK